MEDFETRIQALASKLTKEDIDTLVQLIGHVCNDFILHSLKPRSEARIESVCAFVDCLQNIFDHKTPKQRAMDALNRAFGDVLKVPNS
jgi:hypothetical protein